MLRNTVIWLILLYVALPLGLKSQHPLKKVKGTCPRRVSLLLS